MVTEFLLWIIEALKFCRNLASSLESSNRFRKCCFFDGTNKNASGSYSLFKLSLNAAHSLFFHVIPFEAGNISYPEPG